MGISRWIAVENLQLGRRGSIRGLAGSSLDSALERGEGGEELAVARVGEDPRRLVDRHPLDGVHFIVRPRHPARRVHHPVADELMATFVVGVRGARQLEAEGAPKSRLLLDFPERAFLVRLTALELALGAGPVPPMRTVTEAH